MPQLVLSVTDLPIYSSIQLSIHSFIAIIIVITVAVSTVVLNKGKHNQGMYKSSYFNTVVHFMHSCMFMRVCVCVCVCVCVRACVRARARALRIVSMDKILRFINTLIIIILL